VRGRPRGTRGCVGVPGVGRSQGLGIAEIVGVAGLRTRGYVFFVFLNLHRQTQLFC
jgi:hypothetical protein